MGATIAAASRVIALLVSQPVRPLPLCCCCWRHDRVIERAVNCCSSNVTELADWPLVLCVRTLLITAHSYFLLLTTTYVHSWTTTRKQGCCCVCVRCTSCSKRQLVVGHWNRLQSNLDRLIGPKTALRVPYILAVALIESCAVQLPCSLSPYPGHTAQFSHDVRADCARLTCKG